ncbi:TonB-dependent receptor [Seonamhaeicola algicola]|uniref:TonB-dependent receptor n=1 Tax=Seonamhaeicola algicola TaxID=1719036 RepID=A0A5C7AU01_9FLAO|nr:TonB-dependent receptor [Seonamhaeicola algicola]TXE11584.1 TonB-dependent receptor [Seonamhaeicola algicola]
MKKIISILCLLCISAVMAQEDLEVSVINFSTGLPVNNVEITLVNQNISYKNIKTTNNSGKVLFNSIPVINNYQIVFEGNNMYAAQVSERIDVRSNQELTAQLWLLPVEQQTEDLQEIIINSNTGAKINRTSAEVAFELKKAELEALPVEGRDITRALFRLPNVAQATGFFSEAPNVSINGGNGLFTSYLIDGLDNNERFLGGQKFAIPVGFTKDITVLTNNYSAEFGLSNNGVINVTTKSGSNNFTGEVFFVTRPGSIIDASSPFAQQDLSGNQVQDGFMRFQQGFSLGGPIVKNKTFFFVNAEYTRDTKDNLLNSEALNVNETVTGHNNFSYFSGKIDHNWSQNFRSSLRANVGLVAIERQGGGLEGGVTFPSAGNFQDRKSFNLAFKNDIIGNKFSFQSNIQYARFRWNYARSETNNSPQVTVLDPNETTIAVLGNPGFVFDELEKTLQIQQKLKYYFKNHTLKAGAGFISSNHSLFGGGNPNGNYTVRLNANELANIQNANLGANLSINDIPSDVAVTAYAVELSPQSFGKTQNIYSMYFEDEWALNDKWNLTFGLRYDYDNLSVGGGTKGDTDNVAPRFNFNYALSDNESIRGGYGIFYDKINYAIYSDALQSNTTGNDYKLQIEEFVNLGILPESTNVDKVVFNGNLSAAFVEADNITYLNGPTSASLQNNRAGVFSNERRILNPNGYQNPYTHQLTLGYQWQINNNSLFYVDVVHNWSRDLFRLRNLNAAAPFTVGANFTQTDVRTPQEADLSRPIPIENSSATINGERITGVSRNVVVTESGGRSRYTALSLNYQKDRGDGILGYRLNYTLSSSKNNTEDINFRAMDSNNFDAEYAHAINDRTHLINGIASVYPIENLSFTMAALVQSGQPINRIPNTSIDSANFERFTTRDLNGDGASFGDAYVGNSDRSPGEGRNSDRLPWSYTLDFSAQYRFKLSEKTKLELRADVFNALNTVNLSGYSNNATQSNQIQEGPSGSGFVSRNAAPPRQFQFSARYLF